MTMTDTPIDEDIAALRSYAAEYGPRWKDELWADWYNARLRSCRDMPERGTILHEIRNHYGPSWLHDFAFAEPIVWPNLRKLSADQVLAIVQDLATREARGEALNDGLLILMWAARRERSRRASR